MVKITLTPKQMDKLSKLPPNKKLEIAWQMLDEVYGIEKNEDIRDKILTAKQRVEDIPEIPTKKPSKKEIQRKEAIQRAIRSGDNEKLIKIITGGK